MSLLFPNPEQSRYRETDAVPDDTDGVTSGDATSEATVDSVATATTEPDISQTNNSEQQKAFDKNTLPESPFDSAASRALFDAIDQFQSCGASADLDVPQLVIVGAQSVGKSSLLQSLTDIPFPVGEGCCTRFATRIVSRRTAPNTANQIKVSIVPPNFKVDQFNYSKNNGLKEFEFGAVEQSLTATEFADIIQRVSEKYMGIRTGKGPGHKNFAIEVLKIELSGPTRSHFSIVDIPGIFGNDYNVCDGEMAGVKNMVVEYMKQSGNIVICVADACVDLSNQEIFKLANTHVDKSRLIGVFTKCDLSRNLTSVVNLVNGKVAGLAQLLHHGWFVVRNKTKEDDLDPEFDLQSAENALFDKQPWNEIRESRRSSGMLKKYLGKLLCEQIQAAFPSLLESLRLQIRLTEKKRQDLGPPRGSTPQRRTYLVGIAQKFNALATKALRHPWQLEPEGARARHHIREANESFSDAMRSSGHLYPFQDHGLDVDGYLLNLQSVLFSDTASPMESLSPRKRFGDEPETQGLFKKIEEEVAICSSTQLPGMVHPDVIQRLYKQQTTLWRDMAADHVQRIATIVLSAAEIILQLVCPPSGSTAFLHGQLLLAIRQSHEESLQAGLRELNKYCDRDEDKLLQTNDPGFIRQLQLLRSLRMVRIMHAGLTMVRDHREATPGTAQQGTEPLGTEQFALHLFEQCHHSSVNNTVNEVHDTLKVYYEFSLQYFIRCITNTIVEDFATDNSGTLYGFSSDYIYGLDEAEVDRLGSESQEVLEERELLRSHIDTLRSVEKTARMAMETASQYA